MADITIADDYFVLTLVSHGSLRLMSNDQVKTLVHLVKKLQKQLFSSSDIPVILMDVKTWFANGMLNFRA